MGHSFISSPIDILRHLGYIRKGHLNRIVKTHWILEPVKKSEETNKQTNKRKKKAAVNQAKTNANTVLFQIWKSIWQIFFAFFTISRPEHYSQSSLLPQECLFNPFLIPLSVSPECWEQEKQALTSKASHLILSNIYKRKKNVWTYVAKHD